MKERNYKSQSEINEIKNRKTVERIKKIKNGFFKKINKISKFLARLAKKMREDSNTKITNNSRDIATDFIEIKIITVECFK